MSDAKTRLNRTFLTGALAATLITTTPSCKKSAGPEVKPGGDTPTQVDTSKHTYIGDFAEIYVDPTSLTTAQNTTLNAAIAKYKTVVVNPAYYLDHTPENVMARLDIAAANPNDSYEQILISRLKGLPHDGFLVDANGAVITHNGLKLYDLDNANVRDGITEFVKETIAKFPGGVYLGGSDNATSVHNLQNQLGLEALIKQLATALPAGKWVAGEAFIAPSSGEPDILAKWAEYTKNFAGRWAVGEAVLSQSPEFLEKRLKDIISITGSDITVNFSVQSNNVDTATITANAELLDKIARDVYAATGHNVTFHAYTGHDGLSNSADVGTNAERQELALNHQANWPTGTIADGGIDAAILSEQQRTA